MTRRRKKEKELLMKRQNEFQIVLTTFFPTYACGRFPCFFVTEKLLNVCKTKF